MRLLSRWWLAVILMLFSNCKMDENDVAPLLVFSIIYDFSEGEHGWIHGFADYPTGPDSILYDLRYAYTDQPDESKKSLMLSGKNLNEDLFMYLKKQITGLKPNTEYTITFNIEISSDLNSEVIAESGSSESVYLKAGASQLEPKTLVASGYYIMNIDKGNQSIPGADMTTLGEVIIPLNSTGYTIINRSNTMANSRYKAQSNADGELWLIMGTDSGFPGTTRIYYTKVNVYFSGA